MYVRIGERPYGQIDDFDGQYAVTTFVHVCGLPLIPTTSSWYAHGRAHPIALHPRSVLTVYLRAWAPLLAIALAASRTADGVVIAGVLAIASLVAWLWRPGPSPARRRHGDFNNAAFGMRCEPARMSRVGRARLAALLEIRWKDLGLARSPDDVATRGTQNPTEAVLAYGLLRLAAVEPSPARAGMLAASDRIVQGDCDPSAGGSPYREAGASPEPAPVDAARAAEIEARLRSVESVATARSAGIPIAVPILATLFGIAATLFVSIPALHITHLGPTEIDSDHVSGLVGGFVAIDCDRIDVVTRWTKEHAIGDDEVVKRLAECHVAGDEIDNSALAVIFDDKRVVEKSFTGRLVSGSEHGDPEPTYDVHVVVDSRRFWEIAAGPAAGGLGLLLWVVFAFEARQRRRAARSAVTAAE